MRKLLFLSSCFAAIGAAGLASSGPAMAQDGGDEEPVPPRLNLDGQPCDPTTVCATPDGLFVPHPKPGPISETPVPVPTIKRNPLPVPEAQVGPDFRPTQSMAGISCEILENGEEECNVIFGYRALANREILVLATGLPTRLVNSTRPATIINESELDDIQGADFTRIVQRLPGVTASRNGGLGGLTSLFVRGASSDELLVLVDGVRVNDVSSPGGGFDFGSLSLGQIEQVELLRGSNSVIWGSDALGGVMNLTSQRHDGLRTSAVYGGDGRLSLNASAGLSGEIGNIALNGGYVEEEGFSSFDGGAEADGFEQFYLTGRGRLAVSDNFAVVANARFADSQLDIDGFAPPTFAFGDTNERQDSRDLSARVGVEWDYQGTFQLRAGFAHADIERDLINLDFGTDPYFSTDGTSNRAEAFARYELADKWQFDFGGDYEWTRFSDGSLVANAEIGSAHGLVTFQSLDDGYGEVIVSAGARIDDHSEFGSEISVGASGLWEFADLWRLRASYGEGFKVPTLFQLLSNFGNTALQPARSKTYDLGLSYDGDAVGASVSAFRRDTSNLIGFVSCFGSTAAICNNRPFGTYDNVGQARAQGFEVELVARPADTVQFRANYSYLETENRSEGSFNLGNQLARRPSNSASVSADWETPLAGLKLGADARMVGDSFDNAGNTVPLDGYALFDLRASLPVSDNFEVYGRVENVWGEQYQTAAGFGTQGRAAFVGLRASL